MEERFRIVRRGFWLLALLWLPAGMVAQTAVGFAGPGETLAATGTLAVAAPCGLPLAIACRRLWRLRYRRAAWIAGTALGALSVVAYVLAGLPGPLAVAAWAVVLSLPVWIAWRWLALHG